MSVDEWDRREVCPDGSCIGVIGADGLCKVCGRAAQNWGDERKRGLKEPEDDKSADREIDDEEDFENESDDPYDDPDDDGEDDDDEDDGVDGDDAETENTDRRGDAWDNRTLCSDGACTGVIGPSGRCSVCGNAP